MQSPEPRREKQEEEYEECTLCGAENDFGYITCLKCSQHSPLSRQHRLDETGEQKREVLTDWSEDWDRQYETDAFYEEHEFHDERELDDANDKREESNEIVQPPQFFTARWLNPEEVRMYVRFQPGEISMHLGFWCSRIMAVATTLVLSGLILRFAANNSASSPSESQSPSSTQPASPVSARASVETAPPIASTAVPLTPIPAVQTPAVQTPVPVTAPTPQTAPVPQSAAPSETVEDPGNLQSQALNLFTQTGREAEVERLISLVGGAATAAGVSETQRQISASSVLPSSLGAQADSAYNKSLQILSGVASSKAGWIERDRQFGFPSDSHDLALNTQFQAARLAVQAGR